MSSDVIHGLYIIPILAALILIHELGHFVTARMVGVTVEEFGLGIPPRIKGWRWRGVLWSLNAIPLGGFVRVLGEDGANMDAGSMNTKSPGQRAFFLSAGAGMNFLLAIVLMVILVGAEGVSKSNVYIDQVVADTPAAKAGWQPGDRIVQVAGHAIGSADDIRTTTADYGDQPMAVVLERGSKLIATTVVPRTHHPADQGAIGVTLESLDQANLIVKSIQPGQPADKAGWLPGDRLVSINGQSIGDTDALPLALERAAGSTVPAVVHRDGQDRQTRLAVPALAQTVSAIAQGSPADKAGWLPADRIVAVNGRPIVNPEGLLHTLSAAAGKTVPVTIRRGATDQQTKLAVPKLNPKDGVLGAIGINVDSQGGASAIGLGPKAEPRFEHVPALQVIPRGLSEAYHTTADMLRSLKGLVTDRQQLKQIAGPIGMGQLTSEAVKTSPFPLWVTLSRIAIVLSLNLGVLNLLPLPALDGGRLLFVIVEVLRGGRRVAPEKEGVVHLVGLMLLLSLMFIVAFFDVNRLFDGRSFLP